MATFINTREKTKKLFFDGYYYFKSPNSKNNLIIWDCVDKCKLKCHGRVTTRTIGDGAHVEIINVHSCRNEVVYTVCSKTITPP